MAISTRFLNVLIATQHHGSKELILGARHEPRASSQRGPVLKLKALHPRNSFSSEQTGTSPQPSKELRVHLTLTLTFRGSISVPMLQLRKLRLTGTCFLTLMNIGSPGGPCPLQMPPSGCRLEHCPQPPIPGGTYAVVQGPSFEEQHWRGSVACPRSRATFGGAEVQT